MCQLQLLQLPVTLGGGQFNHIVTGQCSLSQNPPQSQCSHANRPKAKPTPTIRSAIILSTLREMVTRFAEVHEFCFSAQDDGWARCWMARTGILLAFFETRWPQLPVCGSTILNSFTNLDPSNPDGLLRNKYMPRNLLGSGSRVLTGGITPDLRPQLPVLCHFCFSPRSHVVIVSGTCSMQKTACQNRTSKINTYSISVRGRIR